MFPLELYQIIVSAHERAIVDMRKCKYGMRNNNAALNKNTVVIPHSQCEFKIKKKGFGSRMVILYV